ncbi:acetyl-CoA carboxylase biotin carboxylase subunit family protein [Kitasatospora sp. MMS16-BH015]|uniref:ATP-grasp domain-containing protein n=1 Tax=Kitasatospora sp. MMS16-BH015 TaxID=2018025 RepID=UPI000CF2C5EE|nr:hypothetical protein [Kitasatospora sp. MMS16-BH015]
MNADRPDAPAGDRRPVAVLLGERGSLSAAEIATAADPELPVLFLTDAAAEGGDSALLRQIAEALAPTVRVDFADLDACTEAVRAFGARTVATFVDRLCPLAAALRGRLGQGQPADAGWGHKDAQRRTLTEAGVSRLRSATVPDAAGLRATAADWGLPLVVKPVNGVASADTWLLNTPAELDTLLHDPAALTGAAMFVEEYLAGAPGPYPHLADYVSVEVFRNPHAAGSGQLAFVTDRPPLAQPCRETGLFAPSALAPAALDAVTACAVAALDALGARHGVFHVEAKPGRTRPDVIEVNGRLGGFVARAVRYGTGLDLGRLALETAAGHPAALPERLDWQRCVASLLFQPPPAAHTITRAPGRRELARLPGVLAVDQLSVAGTEVAWRRGTSGAAATLWLAADDHAELGRRFTEAATFLGTAFEFRDRHGRLVADPDWLDALTAEPRPTGRHPHPERTQPHDS